MPTASLAARSFITADQWNRAHPVGTPVRYFPVLPQRPGIEPLDTKTRSEAWTLCSGHVVVAVEGRSGGVAVDHLEVL